MCLLMVWGVGLGAWSATPHAPCPTPFYTIYYLARMMPPEQKLQTRVCIIGAGPGGATASLYLSRFKIPHIVVDKATFPRDKVCGESFDGRVYRILDDLSLLSNAGLQQELLLKTWNYRFHSKKIDLAVAFPKSNLPRLSAQRTELDHFLFKEMDRSDYAKVLTACNIREIEKKENGHSLRGDDIRIDTELLIMAGGASADMQKNPALFVFSRCYYGGVKTTGEQGLEVYYFDHPVKGCLFLCPLSQGRYNVEIGVQGAAYRRAGMNMAELQEAYLSARPDLQDRFAPAQPSGKRRGTSILLQTKPRWAEAGLIYIGSGSFCVNPITGLGVGNAMSMGKLAAEQVRELYDQPDFSQRVGPAYRNAALKKYRNILLMNRLVNLIQRNFTFLEPLLALFLNTHLVQRLLLQNDLVKSFSRWKFYRKLKIQWPRR